MNPLSAVYGQVARFRRRWYEQRPHLQRQIGCPVISVGNVVMGGSGKTPVVAMLARLLQDAGYSPAVISRGYKRRRGSTEPVIVSDRDQLRADVDESGDEPQMLARRLKGVPIVVAADRFSAGTVAREQLQANVLILDDGFQHLQVKRTVNLLLLSTADLSDRVFPAGRLREPVDAVRYADALLIAKDDAEPAAMAGRVGVDHAFALTAVYGSLRLVAPFAEPVTSAPRRVVTVAAIARPERFTTAVRTLGYDVQQQFTFRDHHWFTSADVQRAETIARETGADAIVTTEKDAVKLERLARGTVPWMFLPLDVRVGAEEAFTHWLLARIGPPRPRT